ncbi:NPCBM/NEW2 domain-containing protein [Anatilimnocola sp. NA78]|uniref:NPCBM/NEW2 domain-containing protein n=1 Tax=Anatilimnocola sp. NA78 TaxID=3415683 RepID=UPI003CE5B8B8
MLARLSFPLLVLLICAGIVCAQPSAPLAVPLEGEAFAATLAGIDSQQNLKWKVGNKLRVMPAGDLVSWGAWKDVETGPQILLADGGILRADVLKLDANHLVIGDAADLGSVLWGESALPVEAVAGVLWQPPADPLARDRLRAKLLQLPAGDDQLLLIGGETLSGALLDVPLAGRFAEDARLTTAGEVFQLQTPRSEKPLVIAASKVLAFRLGAATVSQPVAGRAFARLGFRDGSFVVAQGFAMKGDATHVQLSAGVQVLANNAFGDGSAGWFWSQISLVQPVSKRVVYVSDLKPLGYKHLPFLSGEWSYGTDQNVLGGQLRTRDQVHSKGLGMFPASRLAYQLDGQYRKLQGSLAIDAQAAAKGSVVLRVLTENDQGQWSTAYESPVIRGNEPPVEFSVDVRQAQRMALLVDFADRGDECDYANWLDLRLLK